MEDPCRNAKRPLISHRKKFLSRSSNALQVLKSTLKRS